MKTKVSEIAVLNAAPKKYKGVFPTIRYLDTSSVDQGKLLEFQLLDVERDVIPSRAQRAVKDGTIVISSVRPNLKHYAFLKNPAKNVVVSSGFVTVDALPERVDSKFLYYALTSAQATKYLDSIASTAVSAYPSFNPEDLGNYVLDIPDSLEEQREIANVLSSVDEKIFNNNAICSNLEAMAKLLYDYWFVQFDFPDEHGKPYKSSGGKMVWNDELKREIPVGWEAKPLDDIITESNKSTVQVNGAKVDGIYPFFTSGSAILAYDQYFVDGFHCFFNTGGNPDIKGYKGKCAYSTDTWCIDAGKYSYFMYSYFMLIMPQFEQLFFSGSGLKHLQKDALKKQCVVLPSDEVIGEFNDVLDDLWDKRTECFLQNQQLVSLRDFLLPMLMNGQVKVGA